MSSSLYAQTAVYLEARDNFDGKELKAEFKVESVATKKSYTIREDGDQVYIEMPQKEDISVKATVEGYYVEDQLLTADKIEGSDYIFRIAMQKRATAKLQISAVSGAAKKEEPANFEVFFQGRLVNRGKTTKSQKKYELVVAEQGNYQIVAKANGFNETTKNINVKVSVPINAIVAEIELNEADKEITLNILDEITGEPITASVSIMASEEKADLKAMNGKAKYVFQSGKSYIINVKAEGYEDLKSNILGNQDEDLTLKMKPKTLIHFVIFDAETKKPVKAHVAVANSKRKQKELDGYDYSPPEKGVFYVIVSGKGYFQKSDTLLVDDLYQGRIEYEIPMAKEMVPYSVTVLDHYSKEVLKDVDFRVFASKGKLKVKAVESAGNWLFSTEPGKEHFIEASKATYSNLTKMLSEDSQKFNVELFWAPEYTYNVKLIDRDLNKTITDATLKVENQTGKLLFVYHEPNAEVYKVKIDKNQSISYSVNAAGYKSTIAGLHTDSYNNIELYLERSDSQEIIFQAEDYLTAEKLKPTLKYYRNNGQVELKELAQYGQYSGKFNGSGNYRVEAFLSNYESIKEDITKEKASKQPYVLKLKKDFYTVRVWVENFKSSIAREGLEVRVMNQNNQQVPERFNSLDNCFETDLKADEKYTLEIAKAGFESYYRAFELKDLVKDKFEIRARLKEKPKPVEKIEAIKLEKPALAMPKADEMAAEFAKKESVGKRYLLDQVFFDQSSAVIRDSEVPQLNELALRLKENPNLTIAIVGHTDNVGDLRRNKGLSQFRAKAVANYLFYKGANPDRIQSEGMGQENPVAPNDTEENKAKNRRVEMVLIEN